MKDTAKPPNIRRTTWTISVIATALSPPDNEYARDNAAKTINPLDNDNPVSVFIANDPNHKTVVKLIKT